MSVTLLTKEDMYNQASPIYKCCLLTVLISENIGNQGEDCDKYVEEDNYMMMRSTTMTMMTIMIRSKIMMKLIMAKKHLEAI